MNGKGSVQKFSFSRFLSSKISLSFILSLVFAATLIFSSTFAFADCYNPTIYNQNGGPISPLSGEPWLTINGTAYDEMQIDFPLTLKNKNAQGMRVTLKPYHDLRDYIDDATIYLNPGETASVDLRVWVGGQSYIGVINVYYTCDDGIYNVPFQFIKTYIIGQKIEPPPVSTCESHDLDGCYQGMKRDYYCSKGELLYSESCAESCCEQFGGPGSFCSQDKQACYTWDTLPPGTEGNVAFICKDEECMSGNERYVMFMLRALGWNVTARPHEAWTDWEIESYDIIACSDQKNACKFEFNSLAYNQHTNERKPFLEITNGKSAYSAFAFEYITDKRGTTKRENPFVNPASPDYITDGYVGSVQTVKGATNYVTVKDSYLTPISKDLADAGNGDSSVMFKVKEAVDHGRYAFIGWLYDSTTLTEDGRVLMNRTLKWLNGGDAVFGGQNDDPQIKGDIAFVCEKDDCSKDNEIALIKYLRQNRYSIVGKAAGSWAFRELETYDLIVCSDSKTCTFKPDSPLYLAHENSGIAFLEVPYNGGVAAAETFGYTHTKASKKSAYGIISQGASMIFSGFDGYMETFADKASMAGPNENYLNPAIDLANIPYSEDKYGRSISAMFVSDANVLAGKGRYAYIGWLPDMSLSTENGKKLLLRTIDWLICGDACLQDFGAAFGDLSLKFDVYSPVEKDYDTAKIYINISAKQRVKEIVYSINGSKESKLCKDCSSAYKRLSINEGQNQLKVILRDYANKSYEKIIGFFVDSKKPIISAIYPAGGYITPTASFSIKYTEDFLKSITLFYGTYGAGDTLESKELPDCKPGRNQVCAIQIDLTKFLGKQIKYYFVVADRTHTETSRPLYATVQ